MFVIFKKRIELNPCPFLIGWWTIELRIYCSVLEIPVYWLIRKIAFNPFLVLLSLMLEAFFTELWSSITFPFEVLFQRILNMKSRIVQIIDVMKDMAVWYDF